MSPFANAAHERLASQSKFQADICSVQANIDYHAELIRSLDIIAEPLQRVEVLLRESLRSPRTELQPPLDYVAALGGKRLRPALLLLSAQAFRPVNQEAIRLAVVVELVHTATLIHDDILDAANIRRHRATLHQQWDVPRAILIGDWLFTQAYHLANAGTSTVPGRWVAAAAKAVCEGEIQQGSAAGRSDLSEAEYFQMLGGKTGALTGISCSLGAWAAGCEADCCEQMHDFGMKLGTAFQIHDDWLDLWGDEDKTGKPIGADLQGGKWTLPVIRYSDQASASEQQQLKSLLSGEMDVADISAIRSLLNDSDASDYTRATAQQMVQSAIATLADLPPSSELEALTRLARAAVHRTS